MNKTDIDSAFSSFEKKYSLQPIFRMAKGDILGAFILTKDGESFIINFESSEADIVKTAAKISPANPAQAEKDLRALKAFCSNPQAAAVPAPGTLQ